MTPQPPARPTRGPRSPARLARFAPLLTLLLLPALLGGCAEPEAGVESEEESPPTLVVLVSVDQLRTDLLTRYDTLYTGGLRRLLDEGRFYTGASHRHANTSTAPGHTTLATGRHPANHGIVGNAFYELQADSTLRSRYAVEDTTSEILGFPGLEGRSPRTLLADGLPDWVLAADTASRVLSISNKDRSAITMGGLTADTGRVHVYWMNPAARRFVTSAFYRATYPSWVERFNRQVMPAVLADTVWAQQTPEAARVLARPDSAPYEADGVHVTFPHLRAQEAGPAEDQQNAWYQRTPFPDAALVAFTDQALAELDLGRRGVVDFVAISFSQADYIGHSFGPLSQEQLDNLLHLDRVLDQLLTLLDERVGEGRWVLGFSGDHGVLTMPEYLAEQGIDAARTPADFREQVARRVQEVIGADTSEHLVQTTEDVREQLAQALEQLPQIAAVYTPAGLEAAPDSFATLYRNSYRTDRRTGLLPQLDLLVRLSQHALLTSSSRGTSHGSPYWYDRAVPLVLLGAGVEAGRDEGEAYTVDLAPTLAEMAGVAISGEIDGRSLGGGSTR